MGGSGCRLRPGWPPGFFLAGWAPLILEVPRPDGRAVGSRFIRPAPAVCCLPPPCLPLLCRPSFCSVLAERTFPRPAPSLDSDRRTLPSFISRAFPFPVLSSRRHRLVVVRFLGGLSLSFCTFFPPRLTFAFLCLPAGPFSSALQVSYFSYRSVIVLLLAWSVWVRLCWGVMFRLGSAGDGAKPQQPSSATVRTSGNPGNLASLGIG